MMNKISRKASLSDENDLDIQNEDLNIKCDNLDDSDELGVEKTFIVF